MLYKLIQSKFSTYIFIGRYDPSNMTLTGNTIRIKPYKQGATQGVSAVNIYWPSHSLMINRDLTICDILSSVIKYPDWIEDKRSIEWIRPFFEQCIKAP